MAAHDKGHPSLLVPPTFLFSLSIEGETFTEKYGPLGMDLSKLLHGAQDFNYYGSAYAGDHLTFQAKIIDIFSKKDGALDFLIEETKSRKSEWVTYSYTEANLHNERGMRCL